MWRVGEKVNPNTAHQPVSLRKANCISGQSGRIAGNIDQPFRPRHDQIVKKSPVQASPWRIDQNSKPAISLWSGKKIASITIYAGHFSGHSCQIAAIFQPGRLGILFGQAGRPLVRLKTNDLAKSPGDKLARSPCPAIAVQQFLPSPKHFDDLAGQQVSSLAVDLKKRGRVQAKPAACQGQGELG